MKPYIVILAIVAVAVLGLCGADATACPRPAQVVGFAPQVCAGAYTASYSQNFVAAPQPASYWVAPAAFYSPPPAQFVQQEVLGYAPQPVAQVNVAYAQRSQLVGFADAGYNAAAVVGAPVALRGRYAGNPAVNVAPAQLNLAAGKSRARVLRPTLFKRAVGAPVVGAVVVPGY